MSEGSSDAATGEPGTTPPSTSTPPAGSSTPPPASPGNDAAAQRVTDLERQLEEWKGHARKHEDRAREMAGQLKGTKSDKERLAELEQAISSAQQDQLNERAFSALTQVQLRLAEAGIKSEDVAGLIELVDASALLKDGKPHGETIKKFADSLIKVAARATPDPDQGRSGGDGPADMNTLIRRAVGVQI